MLLKREKSLHSVDIKTVDIKTRPSRKFVKEIRHVAQINSTNNAEMLSCYICFSLTKNKYFVVNY